MKYEIVVRISEDGPGYDRRLTVDKYTIDDKGMIRAEHRGDKLIVRDWIYIREVEY